MGDLQAVRGHLPSLLNATLDQLLEGLEKNRFTSVQLTKAYLTRIDQVNETVHAVVETNPDALAIAKALDDERASGSVRG